MMITISYEEFKDYLYNYFSDEDNIHDDFYKKAWLPIFDGKKWKPWPDAKEIEIIETENYYEIHNPWYGEGFRYARPTSGLTLPEYIFIAEELKKENLMTGSNPVDEAALASITISADKVPTAISVTKVNGIDCSLSGCVSISDVIATKADKADIDYVASSLSTISTATNKMDDALKALENSIVQYIDPIGKFNFNDEVIEFKNNSYIKVNEEKKGNNNMFNFDFGPCDKNNVKMSMYGFAIKDVNGNWVSYDKKAGNIVDVSNLTFGDGKYFYKMPVAIKDVKPGDLIIHEKRPMFVEDVDEKVGPIVVDVVSAERKNILPPVSPFGFNFITKIVSLMDMGGMSTEASADNPFGNPMMFLLMGDNGFDKLDPMMMLALMGGMGGNMKDMNPMMLALMVSNK